MLSTPIGSPLMSVRARSSAMLALTIPHKEMESFDVVRGAISLTEYGDWVSQVRRAKDEMFRLDLHRLHRVVLAERAIGLLEAAPNFDGCLTREEVLEGPAARACQDLLAIWVHAPPMI